MATRKPSRIDPSRVLQTKGGVVGAGPVVYWMSRDQRAIDNWALLFAQEQARARKVPLVVVFCLVPSFLNATGRAYRFMLSGLAETAAALEGKGVSFVLLEGDPTVELPRFVARYQVSDVIADFDPLRTKVEWRRKVSAAIKCRFCEVDAHNIVPCTVASTKEEFAARTIRPRIHRLLPRFLVDIPRLRKHPHAWPHAADASPSWESALDRLGLHASGPRVAFEPGTSAAGKALKKFVARRLEDYATARNDPTLQGQSDLSPYLHFGQISAQRVALVVRESGAAQESVDAFLEELIVRRELSDNFCFFNPRYDSPEGFADWAKKTLDEHAGDAREYLYTAAEWEAMETHDELWNAAQRELVETGKMHGYMRMYWGKKILEWTACPAEAVEVAIRLNDTYSLDGRDPNGYAGIAWCIGGVHDRAWPTHPVYGKVRYMNANGCRRKFDVDAYIRGVRG